MNACGLEAKLKFLQNDSSYDSADTLASDVIVFVESKTDETSETLIQNFFDQHGFVTFFKHRKKLSSSKSGGIVICIKKELHDQKLCKIILSKSHFVSWCTLDKSLFGTCKDILLGAVYTPPEGSRYASSYCYSDIENEILTLNADQSSHVLLLGDFNAHVANECDFIQCDDIDRVINFPADYESESATTRIGYKLTDFNISLSRNSQDKHRVNNFGNAFLDMCKSLSLVLYNGRMGNDYDGKITNIKAKTVVDYVVSDIDLIPYVHNFEVLDFDPLLSDIHCPLHVSFSASQDKLLTVESSDEMEQEVDNTECKKIMWCKDHIAQLNANLSDDCLSNLHNLLLSDTSVDMLYDELKKVIFDACDDCGMVKNLKKKKKKKTKQQPNKVWFNNDCHVARANYHHLRNVYLRNKNDVNLEKMKAASKHYKSVSRKAVKTHKKETIKTLRNTKTKDPKKYWSIINGRKKNPTIPVSLETMRDHFEKLSAGCATQDDSSENVMIHDLTDQFVESEEAHNILNKDFTIDELSKTVKK